VIGRKVLAFLESSYYFPKRKVLSRQENTMGDSHQSRPPGTGPAGAEAAVALDEIQRRQEQVGLIVLVDGVIVGTAAGLAAARFPHPATIGTAAGAAVIVVAGPLVNAYVRRLMLTRARQS
jgi:hypothetical protein